MALRLAGARPIANFDSSRLQCMTRSGRPLTQARDLRKAISSLAPPHAPVFARRGFARSGSQAQKT
jgi:hypothetical protein